MASSTRDTDVHDGDIRLWQEDAWWIPKDVDTGVTTQGESRTAALENLDDAVALFEGERGRAPTDEELRAAGIEPADDTTGDREPPDVLDCVGSAHVLRDGGRDGTGEHGRIRVATNDRRPRTTVPRTPDEPGRPPTGDGPAARRTPDRDAPGHPRQRRSERFRRVLRVDRPERPRTDGTQNRVRILAGSPRRDGCRARILQGDWGRVACRVGQRGRVSHSIQPVTWGELAMSPSTPRCESAHAPGRESTVHALTASPAS